MNAAVKAVEVSSNAKVGKVSVTMVSQASCDPSCKFLSSGCYAEQGLQGMHTRALNKSTGDAGKLDLARAEARAIRGLTGKRPLRLHVVGDASTTQAARILGKSADEYRERFGSPVWTYTHAWRKVARKAWGAVSVLASCETLADVRKALARGYAPALVVSRFGSRKASVVDGVRLIPCPSQTTDAVTCETCRLCWNDRALVDRNAVIVFEAHGSGAKGIRRALDA